MSAEPVDPDLSHTPPRARLDSRKRLTLGPVAQHEEYFVYSEEDGRIVLEPAITVSAREAAFWKAHPEVLDDIEATRADPDRTGHPWPPQT